MVKMRYVGVTDPERAFDDLRPFVEQLRKMQTSCKPFGRDYHAIAIALEGLETAAYHFTRRPHFYGAEGNHR